MFSLVSLLWPLLEADDPVDPVQLFSVFLSFFFSFLNYREHFTHVFMFQ